MKLKFSNLFSVICLHGLSSVIGIVEFSTNGMCGLMSLSDILKTCSLFYS